MTCVVDTPRTRNIWFCRQKEVMEHRRTDTVQPSRGSAPLKTTFVDRFGCEQKQLTNRSPHAERAEQVQRAMSPCPNHGQWDKRHNITYHTSKQCNMLRSAMLCYALQHDSARSTYSTDTIKFHNIGQCNTIQNDIGRTRYWRTPACAINNNTILITMQHDTLKDHFPIRILEKIQRVQQQYHIASSIRRRNALRTHTIFFPTRYAEKHVKSQSLRENVKSFIHVDKRTFH